MKHNREHYSCLRTHALLEAVKYEVDPDWKELAIALAARLKEKQNALETARYEAWDE